MLKGFKEFISRGSAIDLAVGVVIGAAFGNIVTALTDGFLMPLIAGLVGAPEFDDVLAFHVGVFGEPSIVRPGMLITAIVNFLLIAAALYFVVIVPMNKLSEIKDKALDLDQEEDEEVSPEVALLTEIRDSLAANKPSK